MSDLMVDMSSLSEEIREKLAELDLELSEGESDISNNRQINVMFKLINWEQTVVRECVYLMMTVMTTGISFTLPNFIHVYQTHNYCWGFTQQQQQSA